MTKRILHVVTNVSHYADPSEPTGLWLSELTHAYHVFAERGYEQRIVSPNGGLSPLEPRSLKFPNFDKTAKAWKADEARMALLAETASPDQIDSADYAAIYFTGGHAVMWDFPEGLVPFTPDVVVDGRLVTGQNPQSAKATAKKVVSVLND